MESVPRLYATLLAMLKDCPFLLIQTLKSFASFVVFAVKSYMKLPKRRQTLDCLFGGSGYNRRKCSLGHALKAIPGFD